MMFSKGDIVFCTAGRENGRLMCVTYCDEKFVYLCDGKERPLALPKKKNPKHIEKTNTVLSDDDMRTDRALRKALLREVNLWQNKI